MSKSKKKSSESAFDYKKFEESALAGLQRGQGLVGEEGILKDLIKHLVESSLQGELDAHLLQDRQSGQANRRNGSTKKRLRTQLGEVQIEPPRDRQGSFEPQLVGKWERDLDSGLDHQILELYSLGNSYGDIQMHLQRMYGVQLSMGQLSTITDRVWSDIRQWQQRALKSFYMVVFLDAIHFKVRDNGVVKSKAVYTVYGVDAEGYRDVLAIQVGPQEGAKQWGRTLEHIKDRGVEDVLFFCVDGLSGFKEAIWSVFPQAIVQRCVVHMVRNAIRFVDDQDVKPICKGLRAIYTADDESQGLQALQDFEQTWNQKYPEIGQAWTNNWVELTAFFGFNWAVRKLIYTTNPIEGLHRIMRKTTKTKAAFVSEEALIKLLYLTLMKKEKVWKKRIHSYKAVIRSMKREFEDRFDQHLGL